MINASLSVSLSLYRYIYRGWSKLGFDSEDFEGTKEYLEKGRRQIVKAEQVQLESTKKFPSACTDNEIGSSSCTLLQIKIKDFNPLSILKYNTMILMFLCNHYLMCMTWRQSMHFIFSYRVLVYTISKFSQKKKNSLLALWILRILLRKCLRQERE